MTVEATIAALRNGNGYRAIQGFLTGHELTCGVGWKQIAANLAEHIDDEALTEDDLQEFVVDFHSRAHKLVSLYPLSKKNHDALWEVAKRLEAEGVDEDHGFPWLIGEDELEDLGDVPQHVHTRKTENGYELFFTSSRIGHKTDDIPIDVIKVAEREKFAGATLKAERTVRWQAFDVVFVPQESQMVQVRVDTGGIASHARDLVRTRLEEIVVETSEIPDAKFKPLNLFPAVRSIYDDDNEGRVTEISFNYATGTHSQRLKRGDDGKSKDVRKDKFHNGGAEKVQKKNMLIFWLAVELQDDEFEEPELIVVTLPGTTKNLHGRHLLAFEVDTFASEAAIAYAAQVICRHAKTP